MRTLLGSNLNPPPPSKIEIETNEHIAMCPVSRPAVAWLRRKLAEISNESLEITTPKLIRLDFLFKNPKGQNSCVWLIANFNRALWPARQQRETSTMGAVIVNLRSFQRTKECVQKIRTDLFPKKENSGVLIANV